MSVTDTSVTDPSVTDPSVAEPSVADPFRPLAKASPREFLGAPLADRLAVRITAEHPHMELDYARRIVDQTVAFLVAGSRSEHPLTPSETVALGWRTFNLYAADYAEFCTRVAGGAIRHDPHSPAGVTEAVRRRTLDAISAAGFDVDLPLWPHAEDD
jgi:hypothetical protein